MTQHLLFDASGMKLAVPADMVKGVHEQLFVQEIEGTRNWFLGLAVVNGKLLPITDLGAFCGQRPCAGRTLELTPEVVTAGLRVDAVVGLSDDRPVSAEIAQYQSVESVSALSFTGESVGPDAGDKQNVHLILDVPALTQSAAFVDIREA